MIGEINTKPQAGGIDIQGIINQYQVKAGENISAGDFVEFINQADWSSHTIGNGTRIGYYSYGSLCKAVLINENKVFVLYEFTDAYGVVCTINSKTITVGSSTKITTYRNEADVEKIYTNKVFISHQGPNARLMGIVATISGDTITIGTDTQLTTAKSTGYDTSVVSHSNNKVFIAHGGSYGGAMMGVVCTVSGTSISYGTDTSLVSTSNSYEHANAKLIDDNKVFILHRKNSSNSYLNGIICTISGGSISKGTDYTLVSATDAIYYSDVAKIDTNKVFVASIDTSGNRYLCGLICSVSDTSITKGPLYTLINTANSNYMYKPSVTATNTDEVFIAHLSDATNKYLNGIICKVNQLAITAGTDSTLVNLTDAYYLVSSALVDKTRIFITYRVSSNNGINGIVLQSDLIQGLLPITTSTQKITGVAQENGSGGNTIDVIEPYTS